jgi:type III pantothenate kinase
MILCLDAGNTRLKCGLHDGQNWRMQRAFDYEALPELASLLLLLSTESQAPVPRQIIACNVAGAAVRLQIEQSAQQLATPLSWLESTATCCGVHNGYDSPTQLGADRWAGLIATRALSTQVSIVVQAGTATTIDLLDVEGVFRGGLILPGLALMHRALAKNTDQLSDVSGHFSELPKNTSDAITSGALHATVGAIEKMRALHSAAQCILSGGAAAELLPHLAAPIRQIDYLVLEGLLRVAKASALV